MPNQDGGGAASRFSDIAVAFLRVAIEDAITNIETRMEASSRLAAAEKLTESAREYFLELVVRYRGAIKELREWRP